MIRHALALALCALAAAGLGAASAAPKADDPKRTLQQEPLEAPPAANPGTPAQLLPTPHRLREDVRPRMKQPGPTPTLRIPEAVHIQMSGVGPYGGSLVSQGSEELLYGSPRFIVLLSHTPLSIRGVIPNEPASNAFYLLIQNQAHGPPRCGFDPRTSLPLVPADRPDIQGDGRVRIGPLPGNRAQIRNVVVPQDARTVLKYYARACAVGRDPETGAYRAVASNLVRFAVIHE